VELIVRLLDKVTVGIVLLLTFLLASFAARNSDLWLHVATGRAIVQHGGFLDKDPFTFTAEGPWVNHSWLWDLAVYGVFKLTGGTDLDNPNLSLTGPVLIAIKAILMVILAGVLISIRRPGQSVWAAVVFTALAMIVLSRWFWLQPKSISFLFLGVTLYLLQRRVSREASAPERRFALGRSIVAIPLLFLLWVNLDDWFVLGPITVGLFLIGELAQQFILPTRTGQDAPAPGYLGRLAMLFVVSLAACLVNPNFLGAFKPPADLWPNVQELFQMGSPLSRDEAFKGLFQSPFSSDVLASDFGTNASSAAIAYYLLAGLGLISFALNWAGWRGWRMMIWLAFFLLSAYWERAIPFFAVVAGPITALNIQDFAARRYGLGLSVENPWKAISIGGRLATVIAGILLLLAAWPGWLHARYDDPARTQHVSWQIDANLSLRRAAQKLRELHQAGVMGDGNGFNFSPDVANYFAWFCPEEKNFFDTRFPLFENVAESYVDFRAAMSPYKENITSQAEFDQKERERFRSQQKILQKYQINHLIVSGPSFQANQAVMTRLWASPRRWTPLYMDGRTAIFGCTPPTPPGTKIQDNPFAAYAFRPEALAFAPGSSSEVRKSEGEAEQTGSAIFWRDLLLGPTPRSLDTDASAMFVDYSLSLRGQSLTYFMVNRALWQIVSLSGPVGAAPVGNFSAQTGMAMKLAGLTATPPQGFPRLLDFDPRISPAAAALLAVRAARRGVAQNPQDVRAYLELATSIDFLSQAEEQNWSPPQGELLRLRQIQRVAALRKALSLATKSDDLIEIHSGLRQAYFQMSIIDLSSEHDNKALELMIAAGRKSKESQEDFQKRIDAYKSSVKAREERTQLEVQRSKYEVAKRQANSRARRAAEASQRGLYKEALNLLIDNEEAVDLEPNEARLALELLIRVGRLDDARAIETQEPLFQFRIAAASGDYAKADEALVRYLDRVKKENMENLLAIVLNSTWARPFGPNGQPMGMGPEMLFGLQSAPMFARNWADWSVIRGVLALESGDQAQAEQHFRHALRFSQAAQTSTVTSTLLQPFAARSPLEVTTFVGARYAGFPVPFSFSEQGVAVHYLNLLQAAKQQLADKSR
jgi:hypothetical protein